jgi:rare lipoprotein A
MRSVSFLSLGFCLLFLHACSTGSDSPEPSPKANANREAALAIKPGYKIGIPYKIKGKHYRPEESFSYTQTGTASWYGDFFHGRLTANGEVYDMYAMTAAHKTLQLPTIVRVTNLENSKSVVVRINDRGPFADSRIIDMSKGAAEALEFRNKGLARVRVEVLPDASRHLRDLARENAPVSEMDNMVAALNIEKHNDLPGYVAKAPTPPPPPARTIQVASATVASATLDTGWFLQAAAFGNAANAERARTRLTGVGPATVVKRASGDRTLYLVRVGPYGDKRQAESVLQQVREEGFDDALLVASG